MEQWKSLSACSFSAAGHLGVRMAQVAHGNTCDHVQVLLARIVKEQAALALDDLHGLPCIGFHHMVHFYVTP